MKKLSTKQMIYIALFVALISVMAQISVPGPGGIPFTLQPWGINLAGLILGPYLGALATIIYVILGAVGAPVFAGGNSGFGILVGPSGGFLWTFPIMAYFSGLFAQKNIALSITGVAIGVIIGFAGGVFQLMIHNNLTFAVALAHGFIPFIPEAILRITITPVFAKIINTALVKSGVTI